MIYSSYPNPLFEEAIKYPEKPDTKRALDRADQFNETGAINLDLAKTELVICNLGDLMQSKSFDGMRKRYLILPFSFKFIRKNHMVLDKAKTKFINIVNNKLEMFEKLVLTISYQDMLLLQNTMNYHLKELEVKSQTDEKKTPEAKEKSETETKPIEKPIEKKEAFEESKEDSKSQVAVVTEDDDWTDGLQIYSIRMPGVQTVKLKF